MLTGLEVVLAEGWPSLRGPRVGLITNHTAINRRLRSAADLLHESSDIVLAALFGPEHGVRGDAQAGVHVATAVDRRTGVPVHSLYGDTERPSPASLTGLDALIFDLQDIGVRYATYISTMVNAQKAANAAGLPFVVLDRPNPINGLQIEGGNLDTAFASFVGIHPIPIRHGMTAGELARLFAAECGWAKPEVIPMRGWQRELWFDDTRLPWVQPSPNLPTLESVTLYPGTCMIEGTNLSEGRGTTRPFEYVGAPWLDPFDVAERLTALGLPGCAFRPASFTPTFSKHAGSVCGGVQIHIVDRGVLRPAALGIHLLHEMRALAPDTFRWHISADGGHFIDLLLGSDRPRQLLDDGAAAAEVMALWEADRARFAERRRPFLLYS